MLETLCAVSEENCRRQSNCYRDTCSYSDVEVDDDVLKSAVRRGRLRNAVSECLHINDDSETTRYSSRTMTEAKENAISRLQSELTSAQQELKLKDEECTKLLKVRDQIGEELEELTASLFEEANRMVIEANLKRMHSEKVLGEVNQQVEVLQAEVNAWKQLVITSTPNALNTHPHPQIGNGDAKDKDKKRDKEKSVPFWRTNSRPPLSQEDSIIAEACCDPISDRRIEEVDEVCFKEFRSWRRNPTMSGGSPFISRIAAEDICTCLNFANIQLAEKVLTCVENNTLAIEPISAEIPFVGKCQLSDVQKTCNYKVKLGDGPNWYCISQHCRNRIAAVCDFFTYVRYIQQGLVKSKDKDVFYEIVRLRKEMALARLGYV